MSRTLSDCETMLDCIECDDDTRDAILTVLCNSDECLDCAIVELGLQDQFSVEGHCGDCDCCTRV